MTSIIQNAIDECGNCIKVKVDFDQTNYLIQLTDSEGRVFTPICNKSIKNKPHKQSFIEYYMDDNEYICVKYKNAYLIYTLEQNMVESLDQLTKNYDQQLIEINKLKQKIHKLNVLFD